MKKLLKNVPVLIAALAIISCGKENSSGSSSSSSKNPITNDWTSGFNNGTLQNSNVTYYDYSDTKNEIQNKSFADGLSNGDKLVFSGSEFTNGGGASFDFEFQFCFFGLGDCNQGGGYNDYYLQQLIQQNEILLVTSTSQNSISTNKAVSVSGGQVQYYPLTINRNDTYYREMLNLSGRSTSAIVVSGAYVVDQNNQQISAKHIEYFFQDGSYQSFVVSKSLPLAANPIMMVEGYWGSSYYGGGYGQYQATGFLKQVKNRTIRSIQAVKHKIQADPWGGQGQKTPEQYFSLNLSYNQAI